MKTIFDYKINASHLDSKKVIKRKETIVSLTLISIATVCGLISNNTLLGLLIAIVQLIYIFLCAKLSLFSIFPALMTFCLFQEYAAVNGWEVYGLLAVGGVPWYFNELKFCVYTLNVIDIIFISTTSCLKNEQLMFKRKFKISPLISLFCLLFAIVLTILIFPTIPNLSSFTNDNRFTDGIISFSGWSIIPFFLLTVAYGSAKYRKTAIAVTMFVIFWYIFHGERVESLGLICLLMFKYYYKNKYQIRKVMKLFLLGFCVILLFVAIGSLRAGIDNLTFRSLLNSVVIQSTACDVTYVFNCAIDLFYNGIHLGGITYLSYLINCIPFLNDHYAFSSVIQNYYYTAGGGLFFAEPIANFGPLFMILITIIYFILVVRLLSRQTEYSYLVYSILVISVFRLAWYGLNYPIVTVLYFVPLVLVINNFISPKQHR